MEIGISTLPFFGKPTLEEAVNCCCDYGFTHIEIMCEAPQATPEEVSQQRRRDLAAMARDRGLTFFTHAPIADVNLMSLNGGIRREAQRQLIEAIRFTSDIGAGRMVFHIGGKHYMGLYDFEEGYKRCMEALEQVVAAAEQCGVGLLMENDPNKFGLGAITVEDCRRVLAAYEGRLSFLLDVAHAFMVQEASIRDYTRTFQPILRGTHFSDNHRLRDEHLGLGEGELNLADTVAALREAGYTGEIILEVKQEKDIVNSLNRLKALV